LTFECSDIFGIVEQTAILNGITIANGATIKLADLAGNGENVLKVTAKDNNNNTATAEIKFMVEKTAVVITPAEIQKIIDTAVKAKKLPLLIGVQLSINLWLYDAALKTAIELEKKGKTQLAKATRDIAKLNLDLAIKLLQKNQSKIDAEVYNKLLLSFQTLRNKI
jgi:hypothetical protein